ncbi:MAG: hypothetical protein GF320_18330 [Armatimonadia bacterium]|nr:hypothetical protein [Armatimonadia bacterium]
MPKSPPVGESTPELEHLASRRSKAGPLLALIGILAIVLAAGYGWAKNHAELMSGEKGHSVNCMECHSGSGPATMGE